MTTQNSRKILTGIAEQLKTIADSSADPIERDIACDMLITWYKTKNKLQVVQPTLDFKPEKNAK